MILPAPPRTSSVPIDHRPVVPQRDVSDAILDELLAAELRQDDQPIHHQAQDSHP